MAAAVATQPTEPQASYNYTFPTRVLSIPLVSSSIDTLHTTLSNSPYTKSVYGVSQSLAASAIGTAARVSAPVYPHLQPVLLSADGYATKSLEIVESKFPYPFQSSPTTIYTDITSAPQHAKDAAKTTYDEKIKTPAIEIATSVDQHLAPLVDLLESVLVKAHVKEATAQSDDASSTASTSTSGSDRLQIARARSLIVDAKDNIVTMTAEQAKTLRSQNVYIQRASQHAKNVNATLAAHYGNAQAGFAAYKGKGVELRDEVGEKVHALSTSMLAELEKLQATTAALPHQVQQTLQPLTSILKTTASELRAIITSDAPLSEKAHSLGAAVQSKVAPVVEEGKALYQATIDKYLNKKEQVKTEVTEQAPQVNGEHH